MRKRLSVGLLAAVSLVVAFMASSAAPAAPAPLPSFSWAWSEYPSWSTAGVAHVVKLIDGRAGKTGPIEEKWGVDIVLKEAEYDPCIQMYGAGQVDAVCITNMDTLNPALSIPSVAFLPTSNSYGADACIVDSTIKDLNDLKGVPVYGLAKSVSEYAFFGGIEKLGGKEQDFKFTNMDPGAAALAMQQSQKSQRAIMVWNPFVLETLNKRKDVKVLFDSTQIPNEIVDMVVASQAVLDKPGGKAFACAVIDTYYSITARMADPKTHDETLIMLGEKFSHLDLQSMRKVVQQTRFYSTPAAGLGLFRGPELPKTMVKVVDFCVKHDIVSKKPTVGYGAKAKAPNVNLRFDPTYMLAYVQKKQVAK